MNFIFVLLIKFAVYLGLLFVLKQVFRDFKIKNGQLVVVTLVLLLINWGLGWLLQILAIPIKFITLGLLTFVINWLINVVIIWVTDKVMDSLKIGSTVTLLIAGGGLSLANYLISRLTS